MDDNLIVTISNLIWAGVILWVGLGWVWIKRRSWKATWGVPVAALGFYVLSLV